MLHLRYGLLLTLLLTVLSFVASQEENRYGVYKSSALVTITWTTDQVVSFQTEEIYDIERATSTYFSELLSDKSHSTFDTNRDVISTLVQAKKQKVGNDYVILESFVDIMNIGDEGILDVAGLLMFLTNKNTTDSSFAHLDKVVNIGYSIDMVSFTASMQTSEFIAPIERNFIVAPIHEEQVSQNKTMVSVTIVLAFALVAIALILVYVTGGWLALHKRVKDLLRREDEITTQMRDIKSRPTEDTGSPGSSNGHESKMTNPSGILGMDPRYGKAGTLDGLGVKMTPIRGFENGDAASDVFTPGSQATSYSDTGRIPLGITSMRKLIPGAENIDYDQEAAQRKSQQSFERKRLDYQGRDEDGSPI